MKDVLIKIKGTQRLDNDQTVIELAAEGTLCKTPDGYVIKYEEEQTIEGVKTETMLTAHKNDTVILERSGELNSRIVITAGERNTCFYNIPQGSLTLGVYGKTVRTQLDDNGGRIKMVYTIDSNLQAVSENVVEITVEAR